MPKLREELENRKGIPCAGKSPLTDRELMDIVKAQREDERNRKPKQIKPVPPFKRNPKHNEKEFYKQLTMQENAINQMSVRNWLDNRENFKNRDVAEFEKSAKKERTEYRKGKIDEMSKNIRRSNPNLSKKQAKQKAKELLKDKDALHELDAVGGGNNKVVRMGDRGVNRSIGSQWDKKGIAENIETQVREQVKNMGIKIPPNSNIPSDMMMNVKL